MKHKCRRKATENEGLLLQRARRISASVDNSWTHVDMMNNNDNDIVVVRFRCVVLPLELAHLCVATSDIVVDALDLLGVRLLATQRALGLYLLTPNHNAFVAKYVTTWGGSRGNAST